MEDEFAFDLVDRVRQPDSALHLTPQNDQLMSENRILCLKSALRLEWRGQDGQYET